MNRLLLIALALSALPATVLAQQNPNTCRAVAAVARDGCMRETAGDNIASRGCQTEYLMELNRCQSLQLPQYQPSPSVPLSPSPNAAPRIGPPPIQPVNPPVMPRPNR